MNDQKKVRLNVYLEPEVDEVLRAVSVLSKVSITDIIDDCLKYALYTDYIPSLKGFNPAIKDELIDYLRDKINPAPF
jgi:hypothetical protein